jgi:hypothetical protein
MGSAAIFVFNDEAEELVSLTTKNTLSNPLFGGFFIGFNILFHPGKISAVTLSMIKFKLAILIIFSLCSFACFGQNQTDTCTVILPVKVYYRDNGIHFISNCVIKNFNIALSDPDGFSYRFRISKLKRNKTSYYVKIRNYRTGYYNWKVKYTMIVNGAAILKEIVGSVEFLN